MPNSKSNNELTPEDSITTDLESESDNVEDANHPNLTSDETASTQKDPINSNDATNAEANPIDADTCRVLSTWVIEKQNTASGVNNNNEADKEAIPALVAIEDHDANTSPSSTAIPLPKRLIPHLINEFKKAVSTSNSQNKLIANPHNDQSLTADDRETGHMLIDSKTVNLKEILSQELNTPQARFVGGLLAGKLLASTLNCLSDHISGKNANETTISYYTNGLSESLSLLTKNALLLVSFYVIPIPKQFGMSNKMLVSKVTADFVFNAATLELNTLYKMFSADYAKEVSFFAIPSLTSMLGINNLIISDEVYNKHSFIMGVAIGAGTEITDFVGSVYSKSISMASSSSAED